MAEFRYSLASLFAEHVDGPFDPEKREFIEEIASALYERHERFAEWPESVRHFYACYDLSYQVGNGGFAQAAYNVPELFEVAQQAFERFGLAEAAAALCQRATAMLPAEVSEYLAKGLTDSDSIEDVFAHFDVSALAALDADVPEEFWVDEQLHELAQKHREDFVSVDRLG